MAKSVELPRHKLLDLETWPRNGQGIEWGCDRDLPVVARNKTHALVYHPPGTVWAGRGCPRERTPSSLRIHEISRPLEHRELPMNKDRAGRNLMRRCSILANRDAIDEAFGKNAHAVITATFTDGLRGPVVTVHFTGGAATVRIGLIA